MLFLICLVVFRFVTVIHFLRRYAFSYSSENSRSVVDSYHKSSGSIDLRCGFSSKAFIFDSLFRSVEFYLLCISPRLLVWFSQIQRLSKCEEFAVGSV